MDALEDFWVSLPAWLRLLLAPFLMLGGIIAAVFLFLPFMIFGSFWSVCCELSQIGEE